ncbi:MAG: YbaB/EbfC family nucleoid-associated protein [Candidatus Gracilibacteria bacterium]
MFDKAKDMYQLQKKAKAIKKELKNTHIEAEEEGVIVTVNGEQEVVDITIAEESLQSNKLPEILKKCMNKAVKKSQQVAAELMKDVMGDMNFPGM